MTGLLCYNRGCGKTFNPRDNPPDSQDCIHHPGAPFFHETYKGWTCCNKKSSDFTEFLNTPGCARGRHSREKPIEPENITGKLDNRSLEEQLAEINGSSSGIGSNRNFACGVICKVFTKNKALIFLYGFLSICRPN